MVWCDLCGDREVSLFRLTNQFDRFLRGHMLTVIADPRFANQSQISPDHLHFRRGWQTLDPVHGGHRTLVKMTA